MQFSRRQLLKNGSGLTLAGFLPLLAHAKPKDGALVKDNAGLLDLPPGFRYQIISKMGEKMSDGYATPGMPDGMAAFFGGTDQVILMRNHELDPSPEGWGSAYKPGQAPKEAYSTNEYGGVTRVVYDVKHRKVVRQNLVLTGTSRNCAGGSSPWGWLTCEETFSANHGHVFLCDINADHVRTPVRIDAYGKFMHEAVAIDPENHAAYLTEDRADSCFYRFVPRKKAEPFGEGVFAALAIRGQKSFDTRKGMRVGQRLPVEWIPSANQSPDQDSLRAMMQGLGAAIVCRGEGVWYQDGLVYFTATEGGVAGIGQIWMYDIGAETLTLAFESSDRSVLNMPDNITIHPGGKIFVCEDGRTGDIPHLRVLSKTGDLQLFARNRRSDSEFAGVCFAPDGDTMFVNIQAEGLTLAVHGPFKEYTEA